MTPNPPVRNPTKIEDNGSDDVCHDEVCHDEVAQINCVRLLRNWD